MSEKEPHRIRVPMHAATVPSGHTTIAVENAITLARAVLDSAPAPFSPKLRRTLSEVVYRCAVVPEAYENPEWLALRDQVLPPGVNPLLDLLGQVLPQVAALAKAEPNPVIDQALAELGDLPEKLLASCRGEPVPAALQRIYLVTVREILRRVLDRPR
ncbi:hypothetical protein [Mycobacterium servetii]|uniref:Uncharacterized protein n=1 Tax=Mycobacterium servetii TaxID=3237418 RepID=A0ABV4CC44_9MYCO